MKPMPLLTIDNGERIVHALISSYLPRIGFFKFLSKQKVDATYAWVHFEERVNGNKEMVYRGEVKNWEELETVIEIMNRNLIKTFGTPAQMNPGQTEVSSIQGLRDDGTIN